MDIDKKQPEFDPKRLIDTISWASDSGLSQRLLATRGEVDLDYTVLQPDGTTKCLSREGVLAYFGDDPSGESALSEYHRLWLSGLNRDSTEQHHVCHSANCTHDNVTPPNASPANNDVMPLWRAPLSKQTA